MSGFPLLQLPHLPLLEILKQFDCTEIAIFYLTSKKAEMLIRAVKRRISFASVSIDTLQLMNVLDILKIISYEKEQTRVRATIQPIISSMIGFQVSFETFSNTADFSIHIESADNMKNHQETRRTMTIESRKVSFIMQSSGKLMITFWKDPMEGWKSIGKYLKDNLGLKVCGIRVKGFPEHESLGSAQNRFRKVPISEVIDWTRQNMTENRTSFIEEDQHFSDEDYSKILNLVQSASDLTIDSKRPVQLDIVPFNTQKLSINASWFNFRYFLNCKSQKVHLKQFEVQDIKKIIEYWAKGGQLDLPELLIESQEAVKPEFLLDGCGDHCTIKVSNKTFLLQRTSDRKYAELTIRSDQLIEMHISTIPQCKRRPRFFE